METLNYYFNIATTALVIVFLGVVFILTKSWPFLVALAALIYILKS